MRTEQDLCPLQCDGHARMKRKRQRIALTVDDIALLEFGFAESSSGMIFYMRLPGRDIHLTYFERNEEINCHITDSQREPQRVWEISMGTQELAERLTRALRRSVSRYNWNEKYWMFQQPMLDLMGQFSGTDEGDESSRFNLLDTVRLVSSLEREEDLILRARIREGMALGNRPGFQYSLSQSYIVFPFDERMCFRMNADYRKSYVGKTPFGMGILRYMKYLQEELTEVDMKAFIDQDTIEKAKTAMETAILESTTEITSMRS